MSRGAKTIKSRWTTIDGLRMHARVATDLAAPGAPVIVLVHGIGVASPYFVPTIEQLAPHAQVFAIDLPGFGRSDKPSHTLTITELADALAAWLRAEGLALPIVLGNSVGCQIAVDFAVRYPHQLERLILTGPTMDPRARSAWRQIGRWLRNAPYERASQLPISLRDYWQCGIRRLVRTFQFALKDRIEEKLPRVQVPTLVVRGEKDAIVPQRWAEEATRLLPRGDLVVIPGVGHTVNYNSPAALARLVREFAGVFVLSGETKRGPASRAPRRSHGKGRRSRLWRAVALLLGLGAIVLVTLLHPRPLVSWLARRHPEILFQQATAERLVALTIDDSPHPRSTPQILDVLAAHDAHATFFLIGERIPSNEAIVRRIVAEGHELGNHLMADAPSIRLSPEEFERQLQQTHALLAPYGPVRWLRPGAGWFSRRMLDQIRRHGYRCALGSSHAFDCQIRSAWYVARHILLTVRPGAVIVLHDGAPHGRRTVAVLRHVLPQLQRRGYRFVTLSELAELEVGQPVAHAPVTC